MNRTERGDLLYGFEGADFGGVAGLTCGLGCLAGLAGVKFAGVTGMAEVVVSFGVAAAGGVVELFFGLGSGGLPPPEEPSGAVGDFKPRKLSSELLVM